MERLDYTEDAKLARAILYGELNDIHFFVEDWEDEYIYEEIIKRTLEGTDIRIRTIHCMGSKKDVKKVYYENGAYLEGVPCFYIVDGDFERYVDFENMIADPNFHYLKRYNIESYYIEKGPIIRHIQGKVGKGYEDIDSSLKYDDWERQIDTDYYELFLLFLYIQKEGLPYSNSSLNHSRRFLDEKGYIDRSIMEDFKKEIGLSDQDWKVKKKALNNMFEKINGRDNRINLICGKFILTGINKLFMYRMNGHFNMQEFIWDLARNIDRDKFTELRESIEYVFEKNK